MQQNQITPHETLEVHELLMAKTVCANKSAMMVHMAQDPQLKGILTSTLNQDKQHITDLKGFLSQSVFQSGGMGQSQGMSQGQSSQGQNIAQGMQMSSSSSSGSSSFSL